ncbi:SH3 domain-containing protein [Sagittula sp. S175]|uniref:SH3 domain-containing protein n=1 Tax=Sagittula sp. S175 TaxID=3415129 RepID=UPI003C7E41A9
MLRIFLITFGVLGWAWYELSGGSNFVPGEHGVQLLAAAHQPVAVDEPTEVVARDTPAADLNAIIQPAVARPAVVRAAAAPVAVAPILTVDSGKQQIVATPAVFSDAMPADEDGSATIEQAVAEAALVDYRTVTASRVNLRGGPSTSFDVLTQLLRGEEVEILDDAGDGWVKLRALDGNDIGWMADSFLTAAN